MARSDDLRASAPGYGVTGSASHADIKALTKLWMPQLRFHELERFHPFALGRYLEAARNAQIPPASRVPTLDGPADPPVIFGELIQVPGPLGVVDFETMPLEDYAYFTMLPGGLWNENYDAAIMYFGGAPGGGIYQPRNAVSALGEFRLLLETLEQNILARLRPDFAGLNDPLRDFIFGKNAVEWGLLLALIASSRFGKPDRALLATLEGMGVVTQHQWDAITRFGFLEIYFHYAYNDFDQQSNVLGNEHEGDVEGCCLVFDRGPFVMNRDGLATNGWLANANLKPRYIITSAHHEWQHHDNIKNIYDNPREDLTVWVAKGSHASYLSGGEHELWTLTTALTEDLAGILVLLAFPWLLPIALALDHFAVPSDETSDNGPHAYSNPNANEAGGDANRIPLFVEVTPLSTEKHIYTQPAFDQDDSSATLAERAFPGKWGRHREPIDTSPTFPTKTRRYLNRVVDRVNQ